MFLLRRATRVNSNHLKLQSKLVIENGNSTLVNSTREDQHIVIPNRIERSSTDILRALASTVGNDPTAPHYKYHDDPYLIPVSVIGKRTFAMAQEAGKKAAKWIRQEHSNLFQHNVAEPPIEAFAPKVVFTENSGVDETCLLSLINSGEIIDAIFVYNLLKTKEISISNPVRQSLLELVCFYNNNETIADEYIEERWFRQSAKGGERLRKTWKDGELAESIFNEIEPKTPEAYASLIRGMCKYYQVERAYALFQEATERQIEIDTKTFNSLLSVCNFLKESGDLRWELVQDLLRQMNERLLRPDLGTLNAVLETISTIGNTRLSKSATLKVLSEFKKLGIEPCLATYYYVLIIFCRERGPISHVLVDILREIEGKEFQIQDPKDTFFFITAMDVCRNHLFDKNLAKRVDNLLHNGNNYDLIGDSYKETIYYRNYFALLCQTEPIEVFMETYDLLVPNVYIPEPGIMEEILKTVDVNGALELVPRLWSDMVIFDHTYRERLLDRILKIMVENEPKSEIASHKNLPEQFAKVAEDIYTKIDEQSEGRVQRVTFTGQMIGNILILLVRGGLIEKAFEVFSNIDKNQHKIPGTPTFVALDEFIDACIAQKAPSHALNCLQYCVENAMNAAPLAKKIQNGFTLSEGHTSKLTSLVGPEYLSESI